MQDSHRHPQTNGSEHFGWLATLLANVVAWLLSLHQESGETLLLEKKNANRCLTLVIPSTDKHQLHPDSSLAKASFESPP